MDKKYIENIDIRYADNVLPDKGREANLITNVNNWLSPITDKLNAEKTTLVLFFGEETKNRIWFENISSDLQDEALKILERYLPY